MENTTLKAKTRENKGRGLRTLRNEGLVPAVLYGHKVDLEALSIDTKELEGFLKTAGESTIVQLYIDDKKEPRNVIIKEIQIDPINENVTHLDFYQVKMTEKMKAKVKINYTGESQAVKESGGILIKNFSEVEIECLPADLPKEIELDITPLTTFEDILYIKDLNVPDNVKIMPEPDEVVATVTPPRSEKELEELDQEVEEKVDEVEGVEKEEEEMEATEEEAAAAPEKKDKGAAEPPEEAKGVPEPEKKGPEKK